MVLKNRVVEDNIIFIITNNLHSSKLVSLAGVNRIAISEFKLN